MPMESQSSSGPSARDDLDHNLLRSLVDNVQDVITVIEPDGTILFQNPAIETVMGYRPGALLEHSVFDYLPPDDHQTVQNAITDALSRPTGTASADHRFRHADGSWRYCESIGKVIRRDDGRINIVATTRDLTDRHVMECHNHLLLSALDSAANSIAITDADGRIVWVNAAFTTTTGYSFDEAVGRNPNILKSGRHDQPFYQQLWDTIKSGNVWTSELINKRKDGSLYTEEMSITPVRDERGDIRHFVAIMQDVSARVETDRQMRLLSSIVEQTTEGIAVLDMDGHIMFVNSAYAQMHGYLPEQLLGKHLSILCDGEHLPLVNAAIRQAIETGTYVGELGRVRADGSRFPATVHGSLLCDEQGKPIGVIGAVRDITDLKATEKLEQERESLQSAVQAMNQVFGVLGHELRTPLAALRASSELLLDGTASGIEAAAGPLINMIHDETVRMAKMVDNILEAARLNSGRAKWQWSSVDLDKTCHDAVRTIMPLIDSARVALECHVDPPGLIMQGDADAIRRLLINLLNNAVKHTTAGKIAVAVHEAVACGRRQIIITCRDTGEGINPQIADKLGEPFALNAGLVGGQYVSGAGLGLAICKGITAAHGGTITVRSKRNSGTTFRVTLDADLDEPQSFDASINIAQEAA